MDWFAWEKLIERWRGRPKRSPRDIVQSYGRQVQPTQSPVDSHKPIDEPFYAPPSVEENFVLDIDNQAALESYVLRLKNLSGFERFDSQPSLNWLRVRIDRVTKELRTLNTPPDFDDEFNSKLANIVREAAKHMLDIFQYAKNSTQLDELSRAELTALVEDYLASIGVTKKVFNVGDDYTDWADLGMSDSYELIPTTEYAKASTIAAIEIQPHEIRYRNENGEVERIIFGGSCKVYKLKES